jgi:hypothetical protein
MSLLPQGDNTSLVFFDHIDAEAVEKILNLDKKVVAELNKIQTIEFNIFNIKEDSKDNELVTVICHIMAKERIFDNLPIVSEKFLAFIRKVQSLYNPITYHNKTHGADLAQTFYYIAISCELKQKCDLDDWDMMSYIIAGACHDVGHPGFSNPYLIEQKD